MKQITNKEIILDIVKYLVDKKIITEEIDINEIITKEDLIKALNKSLESLKTKMESTNETYEELTKNPEKFYKEYLIKMDNIQKDLIDEIEKQELLIKNASSWITYNNCNYFKDDYLVKLIQEKDFNKKKLKNFKVSTFEEWYKTNDFFWNHACINATLDYDKILEETTSIINMINDIFVEKEELKNKIL